VKSGGSHNDTLLPADLDWNVSKKDVNSAQKYMHEQCPGGGGGHNSNVGGVFAHADENRALYRTVAVGRKNEIELLSLIMEIYELSHIDNIVRKERKFKDPSQWKADCKFFNKNKKPGDMLIRAILEFNKRIAGGGPAELIMNPIQDDINVYVGYTMMLSRIIAKLVKGAEAQKVAVCPFQVDLVICGRRQKKEEDGNGQNEEEEEDDDDDDDDDGLGAHLGMAMGFAPMVNQFPEHGIADELERAKIDCDSATFSLKDEARTFRGLNELIQKKIEGKSHKRIVVLVDRMDAAKEDQVYVYQTGIAQHDEIRKDYSELHMAWKTKTALIPNYKKPDDEMNPLLGASTDFGDNAFVFSFHVRSDDFVKCDQWIKAQKSPFLPYHMVEVWPMYFHKKSAKLNKEYTVEHIYDQWGLPMEDIKTRKWIQTVDPKFYETFKKQHVDEVEKMKAKKSKQ